VTRDEILAVSQMGYTNETIALGWLDHFIKHVDAGLDIPWRVLLLNGHITHHQNDFVIKCHENKIVPIAFPSHLTHVLQPLDLGVFCPWKLYHNKVIHHTLYSLDIIYTMASFFRDLSPLRQQTLQPFTIKNSFKESGLLPVSFKKTVNKMRHDN